MNKKLCVGLIFAMLITLLGACGSDSGTIATTSNYEGSTENFKPFYEWEYSDTFKKERNEVFKCIVELDESYLITKTNDGYSLPNANEKTVMVKSKIGLKHEFIRYITSDNSSDDDVYIYYGDHKDGVPNGVGILYNPSRKTPVFAGNFKKGKVKGYGIIFDTVTSQIAYESEDCEYKGGEEFIANKKSIKYDRSRINEDFMEAYINAFTEAGFDSRNVPAILSIAPSVLYEGEMKKSEAKGDGKSYCSLYSGRTSANASSNNSGVIYGSLEYDGEWKDDEYNGKGKLYNADGSIKYEGKFTFGKIKN